MNLQFFILIIVGYTLFGSIFSFGVEKAAERRICRNCNSYDCWSADFNFLWFTYLFKKTLKSTITCKECGAKQKITILKKENRIIN